MIALALPMLVLYGLSVAVGAIILALRRRAKRKAASDTVDAAAD
jgi:Sec-independent protein secretion pathway component TatC